MTTDFKKTKAYAIIKNFIFQIDNSIKSEPQAVPEKADPWLAGIEAIVRDTPLSSEPSRFANAAMKSVIDQIGTLTDDPHLRESFGNRIRMDYGTGHELNYLCYLYRRYARGALRLNEVSGVFATYFRLIRRYTEKFNIEAAGARGCWALDDYQLLPYLFSSSENFHDTRCIEGIPSGVFREAWTHWRGTGMQKSISSLGWKEINMKMFKTYDEEVLGKQVVMQHFIYTEEIPM